jgi:hypothetical protein
MSDPIRDLLLSVGPMGMHPGPPGTRAFLRAKVEEAGGDHDNVLAWVEAHGGGYYRTPDIESKALGRRRVLAPDAIPGVYYYAVPVAALTE